MNGTNKKPGLYIRQCCECMRIIEAHISEIKEGEESECVSHGYCPTCYELFLNRRKNKQILKSLEELESKNVKLEHCFNGLTKKLSDQKKNLFVLKEKP